MSEFWIRKMKTMFYYLDINKDGAITKEDFALFGDRLCENENADQKRREVIRQDFENVWRRFTKASGSNNDVSLTEALLIESLKTQRDDPVLSEALREIMANVLQIFDTNLDGFLQPDEYRRFYQSAGLDARDVDRIFKVAFDAIDTNHDGKLSKEEIGVACAGFITSEDETSPYRYFLGDLL